MCACGHCHKAKTTHRDVSRGDIIYFECNSTIKNVVLSAECFCDSPFQNTVLHPFTKVLRKTDFTDFIWKRL